MSNLPKRSKPLACSLCGVQTPDLAHCEGGYVCEDCSDKARLGRDNTTAAVKLQQRSLRGQARKKNAVLKGEVVSEMQEYDIAASALLAEEALAPSSAVTLTEGGEVLPQHDPFLMDTLAAPGAVALDASASRLELLTAMGTDVAALALDAAESMSASNSLEKMLAHQMAVCHQEAMRYVTKAALVDDPAQAVKMMNLSVRLMDSYQKGLLTLKRLRSNGEQRITIQHVNVTAGGQAVIGQVRAGGVNT